MDQLVILIPIALGLGLVGLAAFLWSLRSGQFDDLEGAAHRILFDDDEDAAAPPQQSGKQAHDTTQPQREQVRAEDDAP